MYSLDSALRQETLKDTSLTWPLTKHSHGFNDRHKPPSTRLRRSQVLSKRLLLCDLKAPVERYLTCLVSIFRAFGARVYTDATTIFDEVQVHEGLEES